MKALPEQQILDEVFTASEELLSHDYGFFERLSAAINSLIIHDFERLVSTLYRLDINEAKLEYLLALKSGENASDTIAALIVERQLQKIKSRQENCRDANDIAEEEKW